MTDRGPRWPWLAALCLLPLVWLWPCAFGGRAFLPYDLGGFPPASLALDDAALAAARAGSNFDVTEVPVWFAPEMRLAGAELAAGRLPTWNPHARGGAPLHAHGLLGLCYPPHWLALAAAEPADRLVWLCWISLALAGVLAFGLLGEVGLGRAAAWFGAATFELAAPLAANGHFFMRLASLVWLPGLCWALLRLHRAAALRPGPVAATAVCFAMPWLAGFPPYAATHAVFGGLVVLWLAAANGGAGGARAALGWLGRAALALGLGALLAMPQVLPSLQFFPHSARPLAPDWTTIAGARFDAYGLLGYLLPDAFGHPTATAALPYDKNPLGYLWVDRFGDRGQALAPNYNYTEYAVFAGTLALLLLPLALRRGADRHRGLPWLGWLVALWLALLGPGAPLLYALPVVQNVWPMRWLAPATLFVAWLAARGFARLQQQPRAGAPLGAAALLLAALVPWACGRPAAWHAADPAWPAAAIAARFQVDLAGAVGHLQDGAGSTDRFALAAERFAAAGAAAGLALLACGLLLLLHAALQRRPALRAWPLRCLVLLAIAELGWHGAPLLQGRATDHPTDGPVHTFLREQAAARADEGGFAIVRTSVAPELPAQLPPGQLLVPGLRDLHFYSHFDGRSLQPLQRLLGAFGATAAAKGYLTLTVPDQLPDLPVPPLQHPLFDLLGVRYALAARRGAAPLPQHAGQRVGPELRTAHGEFAVFERPRALPRAFAVAELRALPDDEAVLQAMVAPAFAPARVAYCTAADLRAALPAGPPPAAAASAPPRAVVFRRDHPTEIELEVGAGAAPWLVLTDTWLPGWTVSIDGAPVPILRADHAFRAVALPPGACRVRFRYAAPGLAAGLALAAFATLALAALAAFDRGRRRASSGPPRADETAV